MSQSVREVLDGAGLSAIAGAIEEFGCETGEDLALIEEADLEGLGLKPIQSRKLWQLVQSSKNKQEGSDSPTIPVNPEAYRQLEEERNQLLQQLSTVNRTKGTASTTDTTAECIDAAVESKDLGTPVASIVLPGSEDCNELMRRGGIEVSWSGRKVTRFRETPMRHVVSADLLLPTLYLHFLDEQFRVKEKEFNNALRAGNDNSEVQLVLPDAPYLQPGYNGVSGELVDALAIVTRFLKSQAEVIASEVRTRSGSFTPKTNYSTDMNAGRMYFALKTARPKATISLDKAAFGIPQNADLYLFAENHISVNFMTSKDTAAFEKCIQELPEEGGPHGSQLKKFSVFLKVFYEGGFAYNYKHEMGGGYLPKNVGIACMSVVPAFSGQSGISTGYPYLLESRFLPFHDTVPVTIGAISGMSSRHTRYGLCFTRCVHVWETEAFQREGVLNYCCVIPHGGFFYVPRTLRGHWQLGGLVYAFGEAKDELELPAEATSPKGADGRSRQSSTASFNAPASQAAQQDDRVCVVCLTDNAVIATVPCGHRAFCASAACTSAAKGRPCPVCRANVRDIMRIY